MNYLITQKELTCINILIKVIEEAMKRECFNEDEIINICKTIEQLTNRKY